MQKLNFIKKIIFTALGVLLLLELLGIKTDVFALESGYSSYNNAGYYYTYVNNYIEGYENSKYYTYNFDTSPNTGTLTGSTDADLNQKTDFVNGDNKTDYINRWRIRVFGGSSYVYSKDNVYTFRFSFNFRYIQNVDSTLEDKFFKLLQNNYTITAVYGNTSSSATGHSEEYISNFSYYWKKASTTGRYFLYLTVSPNTDIKYIQFWLKNKVETNTYIENCVFGSYNIGGVQVTYTEGINAVIEEQTSTIINQTNKINTSIEELMNIFKNNSDKTEETLTDDTPPTNDESSAFVDGMVGFLPPGPLDSILNLPLTILSNYYDSLNGRCQPINLPLPYVDENLPLECPGVLVSKINGVSDFLSWIGLVASVVMVYSYLLHLYNWTDKVLTLEHFKVPGYYDEP